MTRQRVRAALAAAAVALTVLAVPAAAAPKKFKATRPYVVDRQTGAVRMPTQAEVDTVVTTLTTLGQQPQESLSSEATASGGVKMDFGSGFAGIVLARPNEDGTWETRCVFTIEEGAEFLGLVEEVQ
jgi:hypothetical protein